MISSTTAVNVQIIAVYCILQAMIKPIPKGGFVVGLLLVKLFIGLARLPKECGLERKLCRVSGDRVKTIIPPSRHQP